MILVEAMAGYVWVFWAKRVPRALLPVDNKLSIVRVLLHRAQFPLQTNQCKVKLSSSIPSLSLSLSFNRLGYSLKLKPLSN